MVQAKNWIRQHNEAGFLLYWIFYLTAFSALEVLVLPQHPLICALDERIPFCAWFAVPYFSWFPALALSQGYYLIRDRAGFQNLCFLMFSGMTVALAVYVIYPISIDVRVPLEGGGVLHRLVALLQGFDSPRNVCPSIHVSSSLAIAAAVQMDPRLAGRRGIKAAVWLWMLLICASTVFIKQHSIVDVFWGAVVTAALTWVTYRCDWRSILEKTPARRWL